MTGIVLKYRVPHRPDSPKDLAPPQAQMDAQRALSLVRSKAKDWGLDPKRIGMLGFSAGGHLTAWTSTNFDKRAYEPIDEVDKESCRPDFTVLIYPAYLANKARDALVPEIRVTKETPPMFFALAEDDPVTVDSSILMYQALEEGEGAGGYAHLRQGRPRLRPAQERQSLLEVAGTLRRVDEVAGTAHPEIEHG